MVRISQQIMFYYSKIATHVSPSSFFSLQYLEDRSHYPVSLKFGRPRVTTNEKIVLASMFYPLYALAVQLSPDTGSSGIQVGGGGETIKNHGGNHVVFTSISGAGDRHLPPVLLPDADRGQVPGGGRPQAGGHRPAAGQGADPDLPRGIPNHKFKY